MHMMEEEELQETNSIAPELSLLLRLVNLTYLSLPLTNCYNYTSSESAAGFTPLTENPSACGKSAAAAEQHEHQQQQQQHQRREFCLVDWRRAKVIQQQQQQAASLVNKQREFALETLLDESINPFQLFLHDSQQTPLNQSLTNTNRTIGAETNATSGLSDVFVDQQQQQQHYQANEQCFNSSNFLLKSTYFTISTILATSAILINLFIILIIIFNTKQKRSSLIRTNSSTGQNNLLLFQLTLTGLLLAGYVLIEDLSTRAHHLDDTIGVLSSEHQLSSSSSSSDSNFIGRQLPVSSLITFWSGDEKLLQTEQNHIEVDRKMSPNREQHGEPALLLEFCNNDDQIFASTSTSTSTSTSAITTTTATASIDTQWHVIDSTKSAIRKNLDSVQLIVPADPLTLRRRRTRILFDDEPEQSRPCDTRLEEDEAAVEIGVSYINLPMLARAVAAVYVWTVAALAYDRYYAIAHPLQYLRSFHNSRTPSFMTSIWLVAIMLSYILPMLADYRWIHQPNSSPVLPNGSARLMFVSSNHFRSSKNLKSSRTTPSLNQHQHQHQHQHHHHQQHEQQQQHWAAGCSDSGEIFQLFLQRLLSIWRLDETDSLKELEEGDVNRPIVDLGTKLAQLAINLQWTHLLDSGQQQTAEGPAAPMELENGRIHTSIVVALSLLSFVVVITIPLTIISICNISIYRIVKVHERRLSVSSGSNVAASSSNISNNQRQQQPGRLTRDDRSDVLSVTSLLLRRFLRGSLFVSARAESCIDIDTEARMNGTSNQDDEHHDCEKLLADDPELTKVAPNASNGGLGGMRRIIVRQDSQKILTKLQPNGRGDGGGQPDGGASSPTSQSGAAAASSYANELVWYPRRQRTRLKRKTSDHTIGSSIRRSSFTSQPGDHFDDYADHIGSIGYQPASNVVCNERDKNSSVANGRPDNGLINQLKLAGLSFAGIAIQEPSFNYSGRLLDKSTSCSLSNLHNGHHHTTACSQHNRLKSVSRCSIESSPTTMTMNVKKSYVSVARQAQEHPMKCPTKLVDNCSDDQMLADHSAANDLQANKSHSHNNHGRAHGHQHQHQHQHHQHQHQHRLTSTIGTKSAAFNALIWLIIGLLLVSLAHYSLSAYLYIMQTATTTIKASSPDVSSSLENLLTVLFALYTSAGSSPDSSGSIRMTERLFGSSRKEPHGDESLAFCASIWLTFTCRLLFLTMLLLNGWLYGIRSRFLRTKMRMVLKKYISRRQASIEINHRNRSVTSIRSRDSSFISLPHLCYGAFNPKLSSGNCMACLEASSERASCKNLNFRTAVNHPKQQQQQQQQQQAIPTDLTSGGASLNDILPDSEPATMDPIKATQTNNNLEAAAVSRIGQASNSIRFMIGDCGVFDVPSSVARTAPTSAASSLNASCRSLISSSIHSSQSAAFLLVDPKLGLDQPVESAHTRQLRDSTATITTHTQQVQAAANSSAPDKKTRSIGASRRHNFSHSLDSSASPAAQDLNWWAPANKRDDQFNVISARVGNSHQPDHGRTSKMSLRRDTDLLLCDGTAKAAGLSSAVKKSSSEFRIYVTAADQEPAPALDLETRRVSADKSSGCSTTTTTTTTIPIGDPVNGGYLAVEVQANTRQRVDSVDSWCKELKQNLTKLLAASSGGCNNLSINSRPLSNGSRPTSGQNDLEPNRRRAPPLIRSLSDDRELPANRAAGPTELNLAVALASPSVGNKKMMMRTSLTMSDIDHRNGRNMAAVIGQELIGSQHRAGSQPEVGSGAAAAANQLAQPAHLKPPNFLKLMFDPNNHGAPFSGASALSPIKECSSNHSCASSQSSLNNASQVLVNQLAPRCAAGRGAESVPGSEQPRTESSSSSGYSQP